MYVILWEYLVKPEYIPAFEEIYDPMGDWAKLFQKGTGYLGTELLVDRAHAHRYLTIDRWDSPQAYEVFLAQWASDYANLDARCEGLTEQETLLGHWESP